MNTWEKWLVENVFRAAPFITSSIGGQSNGDDAGNFLKFFAI